MTLKAVYWTDTTPSNWIIEDSDDKMWIVSASGNPDQAWRQRRPYRGYRASLQIAEPQSGIAKIVAAGVPELSEAE